MLFGFGLFIVFLSYGDLAISEPMRDMSSNIINGVTVGSIIKKEFETSMKNNGQFPYVASIEIRKSSEYICVATIIKNDAILTAAHCMTKTDFNDLRVKAGTLYLDDILASSVQLRYIKKFLNHPDYRIFNQYNNDIAVVWLDEKLKFGKFVNSIHLTTEDFFGEHTFAVGWGIDESGMGSRFLKSAYLSVLPHRKCKRQFSDGHNRKITTSMLCVRNKVEGEALCSGDSGGPLVLRRANIPEDDILLGVFSWGIVYENYVVKEGKQIKVAYCDSTYPFVFANIKNLRPWILKQIS